MALVSDSSPGIVAGGKKDDDDCTEWEYEYDETETEVNTGCRGSWEVAHDIF